MSPPKDQRGLYLNVFVVILSLLLTALVSGARDTLIDVQKAQASQAKDLSDLKTGQAVLLVQFQAVQDAVRQTAARVQAHDTIEGHPPIVERTKAIEKRVESLERRR